MVIGNKSGYQKITGMFFFCVLKITLSEANPNCPILQDPESFWAPFCPLEI